ncbi:MAG: RNA-binding protein [candidate division KSB1 bacterium]
MNLYVGNLAKIATMDDLWEAFNIYADVTNITIVKDRMTGDPLGYAFLEIPVKMEALIAMKEMNGKEICGQAVIVNEARPHRRHDDRRRDDRGDYRDRPPSREGGSSWSDRPREDRGNWRDRPAREGGSSWSDRPREDRGNWRDRPAREGGSNWPDRPREDRSNWSERPPRDNRGGSGSGGGGYAPRKPRW